RGSLIAHALWRSPAQPTAPMIPEPRRRRGSWVLRSLAGVGRAHQVLEMPDAAFAPGIQSTGGVIPRRQPFLHGLADRGVLALHLVAKRLVAVDPCLGTLVLRVEIVEHHPAAVRAQRHDDIGLQPP